MTTVTQSLLKTFYGFVFTIFVPLSMLADKTITTYHQIAINHRTITYTATVGNIPIYHQGHIIATMSYIAYQVPSKNDNHRPITFFSSGGPGESSLDLNLLNAGPQVIATENGKSFHLITNPETWLPYTDEVFIDISGSGLGSIVSPKDTRYIYSVLGDADAFSQFINQYLTQQKRINAKIILAGESYAGFRNAFVANKCYKQYKIKTSGMIFISPMLDINLVAPNSVLAYHLALPTYRNTAKYHHHLKQFNKLNENTKQKHKLFNRDILRKNLYKNGLVVNLLDTRFLSRSMTHANQPSPDIININLVQSGDFILIPAIQSYLHDALKIPSTQKYIYQVSLHHHWYWNQSTNALPILRSNLIMMPNLFMQFFAGYYDAIVPYHATYMAVKILRSSVNSKDRIQVDNLASGHKLYIDPLARKKMFMEIKSFYYKLSS